MQNTTKFTQDKKAKKEWNDVYTRKLYILLFLPFSCWSEWCVSENVKYSSIIVWRS